MDTNKKPEAGNRAVPTHLPGELSVEPLKPRRPSRTVKEIEALLAAVQVAMATDLAAAEREILDRIAKVNDSVEIIARETARRGNDAPRV